LPASPEAGFIVKIADGGDWSVNNLTIDRNGSTIEGDASNLILDIGNISVEFVYDGSTWQVFATITGVTSETNIQIEDDVTTDDTRYVLFSEETSGNTSVIYTSSTNLIYNPSTGTISATNFNSLSDVAFKENIETLTNSLDIIDKINAVSFDWKNGGKKSYGVIAQEIEKILPDVVQTQNGIKSVSYNSLIALLIQAMKEQQKQIRDLFEIINK
jgi:hypothetical protein